MRITDLYVEELAAEASTTRRVLERVPEVHLSWRPHAKSMSLGQLALHVATLPRQLTEFVTGDELDFGAAAGGAPSVDSQQELLAAFASSIEQARSYLVNLSDDRATGTWEAHGWQATIVRGAPSRGPAVVPVQSLVSSPRTAARLPAPA